MVLQGNLACLLLVLMSLLPLCYSLGYAEYMMSPGYRNDALRTLKDTKRRIRSYPFPSKRSRLSRKSCRRWNEPCVPWTSNREEECCNLREQICNCNLWMQNCKCASRLWG